VSQTTDLEKKSLEAHVDLCAQRYRFLEGKLESVEQKIAKVNEVVEEVHDMINKMSERRNSQLINWGVGIIAALTAAVAFLLVTYVF
jgi:DNA repair exonuclease SbcCD ATPase subunit